MFYLRIRLLTERNDYTCDFERFGACGLEQQTNDDTDWEVKVPGTGYFNGPVTDHTSRSPTGQ